MKGCKSVNESESLEIPAAFLSFMKRMNALLIRRALSRSRKFCLRKVARLKRKILIS